MANKLDKGTRVIVATAAVVLGLAAGLALVAVVGRGGGGKPLPYQPFFAGYSDRITRMVKDGGPVLIGDPRGGERSFFLDLDGDQIVARHVIPPGGTAGCLAGWDRKEKRYEDCHGGIIDPMTLRRFPVLTRADGDRTGIFVDLRDFAP